MSFIFNSLTSMLLTKTKSPTLILDYIDPDKTTNGLYPKTLGTLFGDKLAWTIIYILRTNIIDSIDITVIFNALNNIFIYSQNPFSLLSDFYHSIL